MKKRVVAALMAALMCVGMMAGCGNQSEPSGDEGNNAAENENQDDGDTSGETPAETVTIKWLFPGNKATDHDMVMEDVNKKIAEKLPGIQLEMEMIPQAEYNDKITLAASNQEEFDLMFTSNWLNPFTTNLAREGLLALDDLVEQYGQDMVNSMPDWLLDVARSGGSLYAIPNQQIIASQMGVSIQKEYADKYGLTLTSIETIDELYPFLDEIVANEPDLFPIDQRQAPLIFDYENIAPGIYMKKGDESMTLVTWCDIIGEQDKMDNEWFQKGYVRKDVVTVTDNSADLKANRYAAILKTYKPSEAAEISSNYGKEYIAIPVGEAYVGATGGSETMTAINVNSKHPEEAMQLLNLIYTDKEIFNEILWGIEGTHYTKTGDNSIELIDEGKNYNYGGEAWKVGNQFLSYTLPGQADDVWEQTAEMNETAEVSPIRGFVFDPTDVQAEITQINSVITEYRYMQFVAEDVEAHTAEKVEKMQQAGIDTVKAEVQEQLDAWVASQQ